ncbi:class I SAM-dependent methyltransferase [Nonomuraea dietziae]|uniref:class I SAM-dependent methyltransferase n=1 Tax=Nonomuraea dietziae TaxID=65515 RepID=UPI0033C80D09
MSSVTGLLGDEELERSSVVANCLMNRERRLPGYNRELGLDLAGHLRARTAEGARVRWLDLCCGTAGALFEAAHTLPPQVEIVGVDLVDFFAGPQDPPRLRLITASVASWEPDGVFDLITSVHGLHYVGDKLGVIAQAARRLTDDGLFVANFDTRGVRVEDGAPAGARLTRDLRAAGLTYEPRTRRISCHGRREITLPYSYLGSDDQAGPNYTGQPAVDSHYARRPSS